MISISPRVGFSFQWYARPLHMRERAVVQSERSCWEERSLASIRSPRQFKAIKQFISQSVVSEGGSISLPAFLASVIHQ
jgi:hypothetical protein